MNDWDVVIVGGGIAGASLGAEIANHRRTMVIEAEDLCGYHATGRSAAFWLESYGGTKVAPLTRASRAYLDAPPADLADHSFLRVRGAVHLAQDRVPDDAEFADLVRLNRGELETLIPGLKTAWRNGALEPGCADIDVAGLHAAFLRKFRRLGGTVANRASLADASPGPHGWTVGLADGSSIRAAVLVNAAGAWADPVATACGVAPIGIEPKRRTMVQLRIGRSGLRDLPLIADFAGTFYFKGEGDRTIWLSPHDEIATEACDAAPEEVDVATAIDRFQAVVDWPIEAVERKWAGLRSFAPDRLPVYGFDPSSPAFFWCAGQGGFGIQTAPAAAKMASALLLGREPDAIVTAIDPAPFAPGRFR